MTGVDTVGVDDLGAALGFAVPIDFRDEWRRLALRHWVMDADDAILRYVFRNARPGRHLEFGTWLGEGVLRCVEECDAAVWTINLLEGETLPNGQWAYGTVFDEAAAVKTGWSETLQTSDGLWVRTDAYGRIGHKYLDAGWGNRVCQIYCDSRQWDARHYPRGFFDTVFVDGGHAYDVVASDTTHAIDLVKHGGLVMWHDFCPVADVTAACESTRDVVSFIASQGERLAGAFERLFWVEPSWLLFGIRR
jgi:predicted O-methyltransferase YrrM